MNWLPAPNDLTLLPDEVHVWRFHLDRTELELQHLEATLSDDELTRARRFYFPEHRRRFIAGRGVLRQILGGYLGIAPAQVKFDYERRGKPLLAASLRHGGLLFNLSHSDNLALCAVNYSRQIGVDLEAVRSMADMDGLAQRFFLPQEYDLMRSLPEDQKQKVFFRYWTCKEAYLKATGDGISQLEQIEIALTPTEPARLLKLPAWSLVELVPDSDYYAALAVAGCGWQLKCWQY